MNKINSGSGLGTGTNVNEIVYNKNIDFDSITIKSLKPFVAPPNESLDISVFGPRSRIVLESFGFKQLNYIQSKVFPVAYGTNKNLLVSAPTGAGKTLIFLTTVARVLDTHDISNIHVVFVLPIKSLIEEMYSDLTKNLEKYGFIIQKFTGDTNVEMSTEQIKRINFIVTTPEKWNNVTRKHSDILETFKLTIIDEIHLLGTAHRGAILEVLVTRIMIYNATVRNDPSRAIRIVGTSATMPNVDDIGLFLGIAEKSDGLFVFDKRYRVTQLDEILIGIKGSKSPMALDKQYNKMVYKQIVQLRNDTSSNGGTSSSEPKNVLIFVHSKNDTVKTLNSLIDYSNSIFKQINMSPELQEASEKVRSTDLKRLFTYGLAVYHSGLSLQDRNIVVSVYKKKLITVLCSSAGLAWGINLPIHTVIIKGTSVLTSSGSCLLGFEDIKQMFGRAARPGSGYSYGTAILLTSSDSLDHFYSVISGSAKLESRLVALLPEVLNNEAISRQDFTMNQAYAWFMYTFLNVRIRKDPETYKESGLSVINEATSRLYNSGAIIKQIRNSAVAASAESVAAASDIIIVPTGLGRIMSNYDLDLRLLKKILLNNNMVKPIMSISELIYTVSCYFQERKVSPAELEELKMLSGNIKICPFDTQDPSSSIGKNMILFQCIISDHEPELDSLRMDLQTIAKDSSRICRAIFDFAVSRRFFQLMQGSKLLSVSVSKKCWFKDIETPFRQLKEFFGTDPGSLEYFNELTRVLESSKNKMSLLEMRNIPDDTNDKYLNSIHTASCYVPFCDISIDEYSNDTVTVSLQMKDCLSIVNNLNNDQKGFLFYAFIVHGSWIIHTEKFIFKNSNIIKKFKFDFSKFGFKSKDCKYYVECDSFFNAAVEI